MTRSRILFAMTVLYAACGCVLLGGCNPQKATVARDERSQEPNVVDTRQVGRRGPPRIRPGVLVPIWVDHDKAEIVGKNEDNIRRPVGLA